MNFIIVGLVSLLLGLVLLGLIPERKQKQRRIKFEDLSPKQKRYVLRRIKEKQRKENK